MHNSRKEAPVSPMRSCNPSWKSSIEPVDHLFLNLGLGAHGTLHSAVRLQQPLLDGMYAGIHSAAHGLFRNVRKGSHWVVGASDAGTESRGDHLQIKHTFK